MKTLVRPRFHARVALIVSSFLAVAVSAQQPLVRVVASDTADPRSAHPHLLYGGFYEYPERVLPGSPPDDRQVIFAYEVGLGYSGLNPKAEYRLRLAFLSDADRDEQVFAGRALVLDKVTLAAGKRRVETIVVPRDAYADGTLLVRVVRVKGPNAVVSSAEVLSADPTPLKPLPEPAAGPFTMPRLSPTPQRVAGVSNPVLSLDGTWRFNPAPPASFFRLEQVPASWRPIEVPGQWTEQGFSVEKGKTAGYWRSFDLPRDWTGKVIRLRCNSVYSQAIVYLNGRIAGSHLGGMTPFELDVTPYARAGRNTIALAVTSFTLADTLGSINEYAVHDIGGVLRSISLLALPPANLASLDVETTFDEASSAAPDASPLAEPARRADPRPLDATLRVRLRVSRDGLQPLGNIVVRFAVQHARDALPVALSTDRVTIPDTSDRTVDIQVINPRRWDPEHPHLHWLTAELLQDGAVVETVRRRFGFREVKIAGNEVYVNGRPIKLRGVDRHEVDPVRGRSLTRDDWLRDVELFRAANANYIRTSHYPPAEEFIDFCDEMGMFVEEEAPLCWVGQGSTWESRNPNDVANFDYMRQAVLEMIQRDRSHPSVIIWSLANESAWGPLWRQLDRIAAEADRTRPRTFHDQAWGGYNNFGSDQMPIANFHYPGPAGPAEGLRTKRPLLFGEYCHVNTYNREELATDPSVRDAWGRGLERMWDAMYNSKGILGGAIWAGVDDSFFLPKGVAVGYGAWGLIDGWRRVKPEYWNVKKAYSPVRLDVAAVRQEGGFLAMPVENRHDFTNLSEIGIRWSTPHRSGELRVDVRPRGKGVLRVPLKELADADSVLLEFTSPRGFPIDERRVPIPRAPDTQTEQRGRLPWTLPAPGSVAPVSFSRTESEIQVGAGGSTYEIDPETGQIARGTRDDREWLLGGPELMVLPLDGKGSTQVTPGSAPPAAFTPTCANWHADDVTARSTGREIEVHVRGACNDAQGEYWMRFDGAGQVEVEYAFTSRIDVNPRQLGMVFTLARPFAELSWKRHGQWSTYPDDHIGRLEGTAAAFTTNGLVGPLGPASRPTWPWAQDANALGTNDFRSTKENIDWAMLATASGDVFGAVSNGRHHVRAWVDGDRVKMLVAYHDAAGAEGFYRSHASVDDRPLKVGSHIADTIHLVAATRR